VGFRQGAVVLEQAQVLAVYYLEVFLVAGDVLVEASLAAMVLLGAALRVFLPA
jgi:hypothetical protein